MPGLSEAVLVAQKVGKGLGQCEVLLGAMPEGGPIALINGLSDTDTRDIEKQ